MRSTKKPNARQLTSTLMAIVMTATTTFQMPNIALASEAESSVAVESQIEEVTTEEASSAEVQSEVAQAAAEAETQTNTALETSGTEAGTDATQASQASDEVPATVAETTAEVTYEEEKTTLSAEVDPSGEDTEESDANETRGPDEELTTEIETEAQTDAASEEETEASTEEALIDLSTATKSWKQCIPYSEQPLSILLHRAVCIRYGYPLRQIPTHDAQSLCFYNGKDHDSAISSWVKTQLNTNFGRE